MALIEFFKLNHFRRGLLFLLFFIPSFLWIGASVLHLVVKLESIFPEFFSDIWLLIMYVAPILLAGLISYYLSGLRKIRWFLLVSYLFGMIGFVSGNYLVSIYLTPIFDDQGQADRLPDGAGDFVDPYGEKNE